MSFNLRQIKTKPKSLEFSNWGTSTRHRNWLLWKKMEQHNIFLINKASQDAFHSNEYICHTKILLSIANDTCTNIHVTWFFFWIRIQVSGRGGAGRIRRAYCDMWGDRKELSWILWCVRQRHGWPPPKNIYFWIIDHINRVEPNMHLFKLVWNDIEL